MAELKLTKHELRNQQMRLLQLRRYLPTLQLRKTLLHSEVISAQKQHALAIQETQAHYTSAVAIAPLLGLIPLIPIHTYLHITAVHKKQDNIAGIDVPALVSVDFTTATYDWYDTPAWLEQCLNILRQYVTSHIRQTIIEEKIALLTQEMREVYIRVNLFEKVLIPRCEHNMKAIKISLSDAQLMAFAQSKLAKKKIQLRKEEVV